MDKFVRFKILSICKGGGYQYCRTRPPHPKRNSKGLYPLHRVIVENRLGRLLRDGEEVHHKNEDKFDDRPKNLVVTTKIEHAKYHARQRILPLLTFTCICGKNFQLKPHIARLRMSRNKYPLSCSRRCANIQARKIKRHVVD